MCCLCVRTNLVTWVGITCDYIVHEFEKILHFINTYSYRNLNFSNNVLESIFIVNEISHNQNTWTPM